MKTKEIIEDLRCCYKGKCDKCTMKMKSGCIDELLFESAKKMQAVHEDVGRCKKKIADLMKELSERKAAGWISVDDEPAPEEKYFLFTFLPKIIIKVDPETGEPAYWMPIPEPPEKPKKVKTYKDVFLEAFPNADTIEKGTPRVCRLYIFGSDTLQCEGNCRCEDCWNNPYEEEGGAE